MSKRMAFGGAAVVAAVFSIGCSDGLINAVKADVELATAIPDSSPPTGTVSINGGAAYSQSANVTLALSAADAGGAVAQMEVRNDQAFTGNWQAYAASLPWTLAAGDGTKTVYVRFRDAAGNIAAGAAQDSIILDSVNPSISSTTPSSGASNQPKAANASVSFSESMDAATLVDANVYLRIRGTTAHIAAAISTTASSITLNPSADLLYGYDYQIVVTSGAKDLSGRSAAAQTADFTVERDYWEGTNGNEAPASAYDLTWLNPYTAEDLWIDFVPTLQEEEWVPPTGLHSKLALLEGVDYYAVEVPSGMGYLDVRAFFTQDEASGAAVDSSGTDTLILYVSTKSHGLGGYQTTHTDQIYDRWYEYDISDPVVNGGGIYTILVYENSGNYANRRKYDLQIRFGTGM